MILEFTITRTGLTLADLVLHNFPDPAVSRFWISEQGFTLPTFPFRYDYAPDSDYLPGKDTLGAIQDQGTLPVVVHAFGTSLADLVDAKAELEAAIAQPDYTVSATIDGTALGTWDAFPISPSWGDDLDSGLAAQFEARTSLQFLLNPPTS